MLRLTSQDKDHMLVLALRFNNKHKALGNRQSFHGITNK